MRVANLRPERHMLEHYRAVAKLLDEAFPGPTLWKI